MTRPFLAAICALASSLIACGPPDTVSSRDIGTSALSLQATVTNSDGRTSIEVEVHVGPHDSDTVARLTPEDMLLLTPEHGTPRVLREQHGAFRGYFYSLDIPTTSDRFVLDLSRATQKSALGMKLVLPPQIRFLKPSGDRKSGVHLSWEGSREDFATYVSTSGSCISGSLLGGYHRSFQGMGDPDAPHGETISSSDFESTYEGSCSLTVFVKRTTKAPRGALSSDLGQASEIELVQIAKTEIVVD